MVGSEERPKGRAKKKRIRTVAWITDRDGQRIEAWRVPKGTCDFCARLAYRIESIAGTSSLVCERHRARTLRHGSAENIVRVLREVDLEVGRRLLAKDPEMSAPKLTAAINVFRAKANLPPVGTRVVLRKFKHAEGYSQEE